MSATRENVLAAIVEYVETNKRRAPAKDIAVTVGDTLPNVQAIVKSLVIEGVINASRGRNGGALPDGVVLEKKAKPAKAAPAVEAAPVADGEVPAGEDGLSDETVAQFAALMANLEAEEAAAQKSEMLDEPFLGEVTI